MVLDLLVEIIEIIITKKDFKILISHDVYTCLDLYYFFNGSIYVHK